MYMNFEQYQAAARRVYKSEFAADGVKSYAEALAGLDPQSQRINARSRGRLVTAIANHRTGFNKYSPRQLEVGWKYYQHTFTQAGPIAFGRCQEVNVRQLVVGKDSKGQDSKEWRGGGVNVNSQTLALTVTGAGLDPRDNWSTMLNDSWLQGGINSLKVYHGVSNPHRDNLYSGNPDFPITVAAREQIGLLMAGYSYADSGVGRLWYVPQLNYHSARGFDWAKYKQLVADVTEGAKTGSHPMLEGILSVSRYDNLRRGADLGSLAGGRVGDQAAYMNIDQPLTIFLLKQGGKYAHDLYKSVVGTPLVINSIPVTDTLIPSLGRNVVAEKVVASVRGAHRMPAFVELCKADGFAA